MIRTDVPDFLFKHVILNNLEAQNSRYGEIGFVKEWNKKREQFSVQLICDDSCVWVKPGNLYYYPMPENDEERELFEVIFKNKLDVNFEQGIKLFDELSAPEKYMPTWLKNFLCYKTLSRLRAKSQRNENCMSQIQDALKKIIENSCFDDLIVWAKLLLVTCMRIGWVTVEIRLSIFNLCNSCIEDNYGHLPKIFKYIVTSVFRHPSEWKPQNGAREKFLMLQNLYFKTKKMIKNKTFQNLNEEKTNFLEGSLLFFRISKAFERHANLNMINIKKETGFVHEVLDFWIPNLISNCDRYNYLGEILFLQENYEEALKNFQLFQEIVAAKFGNTQQVGTAYQNKVECYIKLGKKSKAKKVLKIFKRFHFDSNTGPLIDDLEEQIKAMPNETNVTCFPPKQKNQNVRAPTKCSSYKCMKIEPYVGAFKHCARCRMTYYCSRKCQKLHWKSSHKADCEEY